MDYREADDRFFSIVEARGTDMWSKASATAFPKTYCALFAFCAKTSSLKTALFDLIDSNNPYAFKALYRCFCEHHLKFMYIWTRFAKEKTDAVGIEYFSFCGAVEARDWLKAMTAEAKLLGMDLVGDYKAAIEAAYPDAAKLTMKELEAASARFRYKEILRYLSTETPFVSAASPFLTRIIPVYAELSSFVHGGPWSDRDMASYQGDEALKECERLAGLASLMTACTVMLSAIAVGHEFPECLQLAANMSAAMRAATDESRGEDGERAHDGASAV